MSPVFAGLFGALGYFTRLPVPAAVAASPVPLARAARWLPLVGALVGGLCGAVYWLAAQVWPAAIAVLLAMAAGVLLTGALHEDGLADTADGLGGGWSRERILEIMKDSRVGSFGVVALGLVLLGRFAALAALPVALAPLALLAGHTVSRTFACALMSGLRYVRMASADAKAAAFGERQPLAAPLPGLACAALTLAPLPGLPVLAGLGLATLATLWLAAKYRRWLGGYTGDTLGAVQQASELAFYLGLLAQWPA